MRKKQLIKIIKLDQTKNKKTFYDKFKTAYTGKNQQKPIINR